MSNYLDEVEPEDIRKAFVLACRFISDNFDCPAADADADFPECSGELDECGNVDRWKCWQRHFLDHVKSEQVCRVCGCTENNACQPYGCSWVEEDLCSACVEKKEVIDGNRADKSY